MKVDSFLNERNVDFDVIKHRAVYDAQRLAHEVHVSGYEVAKTVLLRADGGSGYVVAVLPAAMNVDLEKARHVLHKEKLELATEEEICEHCPDCDKGALPPFGAHYGMQTLVDRSLAEDDQIVFEGNSHEEAIRMKFEDYRRIEQPQIAEFALPA